MLRVTTWDTAAPTNARQGIGRFTFAEGADPPEAIRPEWYEDSQALIQHGGNPGDLGEAIVRMRLGVRQPVPSREEH